MYVLAVSLLGRAIRISSEEQRKAEEQRRADIGDQITEMQQKLEEEKSGKKLNVVNLQNQLRELEKNRDTDADCAGLRLNLNY